jgi:polysaccharide export outer membrane protein
MRTVKVIKKVIILVVVAIISSCGYPQLTQEDDSIISSDYTYIIGPGDSVSIFVWGNPDISTTAHVRPDGKITIPLAEDLLASGKTPSQLARVMEKALSKYVRDPQVVIMVSGGQGVYSQQVRVIGQLSGGSSGAGVSAHYSAKAFPYKKDMTLLDLIIQIGGLGQFADGNGASIIRNIDGEPQHFGIRIDDLVDNADLSANVKILPGDILIIPQAFF